MVRMDTLYTKWILGRETAGAESLQPPSDHRRTAPATAGKTLKYKNNSITDASALTVYNAQKQQVVLNYNEKKKDMYLAPEQQSNTQLNVI